MLDAGYWDIKSLIKSMCRCPQPPFSKNCHGFLQIHNTMFANKMYQYITNTNKIDFQKNLQKALLILKSDWCIYM